MKNLFQKYINNFLFESKFLYMGPGGKPPATPGGAPKGPSQKPKSADELQKDVEHKLNQFDEVATNLEEKGNKLSKSKSKRRRRQAEKIKERASVMKDTVKLLKEKLEKAKKLKGEVKKQTLKGIDQHLQSRIDYHNEQAYLRSGKRRGKKKKFINISKRKPATQATAQPSRTPAAPPKAAAGKPEAQNEKPQTIEQKNEKLSADIAYKIKFLEGVLEKKRGKYTHNQAMKGSKQYKQAYESLQTIKKIKKLADAKTDPKKRNELLTDLNTEIDKEAKKQKITIPPNPANATKPNEMPPSDPLYESIGPAPKPGTPIKAPGRMSKEELKKLSESQRTMVENLNHLENGTAPNFSEAKNKVLNNVKGLLHNGSPGKVKTTSLPDGYEAAAINWPKPKDPNKSYRGYPTMVIYRQGKVVCYMTGDGTEAGGGFDLSTPQEGGHPDHLKALHVIKAHSVMASFQKNLSQLKMKNMGELNQVKQSLRDYAKNARLPGSTRGGYGLVINEGGTKVYFRNEGGGQGEFKITAGGRTYLFHTRTNKLLVAKQDKKGKIDRSGSKELGVLTKEEQKAASEKTEAQKAKEKFKKDRANMEAHLNPDFKGLINYDAKDPYKFTVGKEKPNRNERKLLNRKIHQLMNFNNVRDKFAYITIDGPKGKREALYVPGEKTAYLLKGNKMTSKRVPFYNKDTIKVTFKKPDANDIKKLPSKLQRTINERMTALTKFDKLKSLQKKLNGKLEDFNKKDQPKIIKFIRFKKNNGSSRDIVRSDKLRKQLIKHTDALIPVFEEAIKKKKQPKKAKA
ncbi:hypothetical protein ACFL3T_02210 [Patescibacteria group bacterium]